MVFATPPPAATGRHKKDHLKDHLAEPWPPDVPSGMANAFLALHTFSRNALSAAVALLFLLTQPGCQTSATSPGAGPVTLLQPRAGAGTPQITHTAFSSVFRGFHQPGFPSQWTADGAILKSNPGPGVDLITIEKYRDFQFDVEWKVTKGANSGILYGVTEATSETYWSGPEYQINDDPNHDDGKVPITSAGALYDLIPPGPGKRLKPTGQWNQTRIVCRDGHIEHWLNGVKILEYDWNGPPVRALINRSKFASQPHFMKELDGRLALQHHGAEVWFRHIRLARL